MPKSSKRPRLTGISEIRTFFRTNEQPIYFVGPTAFNLLGIDRWVRNFQYVVYYDSWDGQHPRVFAPQNRPYVEFGSSEEINNYLLRDAEIQDHFRRRGGTPMIAMVFFDEETEQICRDLGYTLILPPDSLRRRLDSKIVTTRLGNEAGAPSVPNVLGRADTYEQLTELAGPRLGSDLVVQTPYGDSGKTTFFISSERDWDKSSQDIVGQGLKVMKRINNKAAAVEACITRHGTIVGPFNRPDRLSGAHSVQGWLVRERPLPRGTVRQPSRDGDRSRTQARRQVGGGGLQRLPRDRCAGRHRFGPGLPR